MRAEFYGYRFVIDASRACHNLELYTVVEATLRRHKTGGIHPPLLFLVFLCRSLGFSGLREGLLDGF